jgi:hypothetical protein
MLQDDFSVSAVTFSTLRFDQSRGCVLEGLAAAPIANAYAKLSKSGEDQLLMLLTIGSVHSLVPGVDMNFMPEGTFGPGGRVNMKSRTFMFVTSSPDSGASFSGVAVDMFCI